MHLHLGSELEDLSAKVFFKVFKGTLMRIISLHVCVHIKKKHPENFAFLILRILEFFARGFCQFLKK